MTNMDVNKTLSLLSTFKKRCHLSKLNAKNILEIFVLENNKKKNKIRPSDKKH